MEWSYKLYGRHNNTQECKVWITYKITNWLFCRKQECNDHVNSMEETIILKNARYELLIK